MLTQRERDVVRATVAALLPEFPPLQPETRDRVTGDVAAFVATLIANMPATFGVPYRAALAGFDRLPLLRHRRPFSRLDRAAQMRWLDLWGERGVGPTRTFVKLLRSCALLAFFDHPLVLEQLEATA